MNMRPGANMWLNTWIKNRWLWRVLFIAAMLYFVVRGPWRAIHDSGDFLLVFTAARCWLHGANPYAPADLAVAAQAAGIQVTAAHFVTNPSVYLPPALVLLSPLAMLPWSVAKALWLACLLALSLWSMTLLVRNADVWKLPVASLLLAFAPLHTGLGKGQPSVLVCGLLCLSMFTPNPYAAGLMLGVAACMKPQLVVGFLLLALFQREYRKLIVACIFGLATTAVALVVIVPGWFPALTVNTREIVGGASGLNDLNPTSWYQLINLHILVPQALYRTPVEIIAYAIIILVTAFAIVRVANNKMAAALIASATVLVGYHRFYDAQILWLAIPAILLLTNRRRSRCLWACYAVFLIPGQTMAALRFGTRTGDPWSWLLLRHETLAILIVWMLLASIAIARANVRVAASAFRRQPVAAP
jgi:hypothetical protein